MSALLATFACCVCAALLFAIARAARRSAPRIPAGSGLRLVPRAISADAAEEGATPATGDAAAACLSASSHIARAI